MSTVETYTIGELAQAANVTTRTIRYYVAQGLLPPPYGGGRAASYGDEHLNRLELIKLLKEEFLPLNEIKALLDGLDDDAVRDLLAEKRQPPPPPAAETAKEYLQALLRPPDKPTTLLRKAAAKKAKDLSTTPAPVRLAAFRTKSAAPGQPSVIAKETYLPHENVTAWQRYPLHPDVELHVRQPLTDAGLSARLDRLIADIRRLISKHSK